MIAIPQKPKPELTREHKQQFVTMLPTITRVARQTFSGLDAEAKGEAVAEVVAHAYVMFVGLVERGKESLAYASVLAMYGARRVKIGRKAATKMNSSDISSLRCQLRKGVQLKRLDRYDATDEVWETVLVEDKHAGPAEVAAARIDIGDWCSLFSARDRHIAGALAVGGTTNEVARQFKVSPSRISKMRRQFHDSWQRFQGEPVAGSVAVATT